ncbi:MAG: Wzz/FepE/Etk N-terminal domain-containing protein, partial [bacterium]
MARNPQSAIHGTGDPKVAGDFGLRYLMEVLFRRKRMLLIPILCTPFLAVLLSYTVKPSYMSTTTIILGKAEILNPLVRYDTSVQMAEYDRLGLFQKIIYSRPLIEDVIRKLKLDRQLKNEAQLEWLVNDVRKSIHMMGLT